MGLLQRLKGERLEMAADPELREKLHYPCLVCVERFKKTSAQTPLVQLTR
jgi:hypothetical protein